MPFVFVLLSIFACAVCGVNLMLDYYRQVDRIKELEKQVKKLQEKELNNDDV